MYLKIVARRAKRNLFRPGFAGTPLVGRAGRFVAGQRLRAKW
jgi:hypothetical protein